MHTAMQEFVIAKAGGLDNVRNLYFSEKFEELDSRMKSAGSTGILLLRDFLMLHAEGGDLEEFVKKVVVNVEIKVKSRERPAGVAQPAPKDFVPTIAGPAPQETPVGSRANPGQNHGVGAVAQRATVTPVSAVKRKYEDSTALVDRIRYIFLYTLEEDHKVSTTVPELMEYLRFPSLDGGRGSREQQARDHTKVWAVLNRVYKNEFIRHEGYSKVDGCHVHYTYNMNAN
jgi:hypothetical protein